MITTLYIRWLLVFDSRTCLADTMTQNGSLYLTGSVGVSGARRKRMDWRYPVGKMQMPAEITEEKRWQAIESVARTPKNLREAVRGLNDAQMDTPYREGGWMVRQVVHHVPDSHLNA